MFRVVPEKMRSFALGVQWLIIKLLGGIPGPILFGTVIDQSCVLWQEKLCTETRGNCWVHNSSEMAINVFIMCKYLHF